MTSASSVIPPQTHHPIPSSVQRISRWIARVTGWFGFIALCTTTFVATVCALLGIFVIRQRDGFASWIPLIIAVFTLGAAAVFSYERRLWVTAIQADAAAHHRMKARDAIATSSSSPTRPHDSAQSPSLILEREEIRWLRAKKEYDLRRRTFFPRVEAAQRGAIHYLGGTENAPWLARDLRISLTSFSLMAAGCPICTLTCIVSIIVLACL